jgi:hypothetical protein
MLAWLKAGTGRSVGLGYSAVAVLVLVAFLVYCLVNRIYERIHGRRIQRIVERYEMERIPFGKGNWEGLGPFGRTHIICPYSLPWGYILAIPTTSSVFTQYYKVPGVSNQRNLR